MSNLKDVPLYQLFQELENRGVLFIRWDADDIRIWTEDEGLSDTDAKRILSEASRNVPWMEDDADHALREQVLEIYDNDYLERIEQRT